MIGWRSSDQLQNPAPPRPLADRRKPGADAACELLRGFHGARTVPEEHKMTRASAKSQPAAQAALTTAFGLATWIGVAAMAFGLAAWLGAVFTGSEYSKWMLHLAG
jgi:hypothetical protein